MDVERGVKDCLRESIAIGRSFVSEDGTFAHRSSLVDTGLLDCAWHLQRFSQG